MKIKIFENKVGINYLNFKFWCTFFGAQQEMHARKMSSPEKCSVAHFPKDNSSSVIAKMFQCRRFNMEDFVNLNLSPRKYRSTKFFALF